MRCATPITVGEEAEEAEEAMTVSSESVGLNIRANIDNIPPDDEGEDGVSVDFGDGTNPYLATVKAGGTATAPHLYDNPGSYTITATGTKTATQATVEYTAIAASDKLKAWDPSGASIDLSGDTSNVTQISAGTHILAAVQAGSVKAWRATGDPITLSGDTSNVTQISAGYEQLLALHSNGTAKAWNSEGAEITLQGAPDGSGINKIVSISAATHALLALGAYNQFYAWSHTGIRGDMQENNMIGLNQVCAGRSFAVATDAGYNVRGVKVASGTSWAKVEYDTSGTVHELSTATDSSVVVGGNRNGRLLAWRGATGERIPLGGESELSGVSQFAAGDGLLAAVHDGKLKAWNTQGEEIPLSDANAGDVVHISAGGVIAAIFA